MSVLILGGDKVSRLESILKNLGIEQTLHWDGRSKSLTHKSLPNQVGMVLMLTDFLNHNAMAHFKKEAKKSNVPFMCIKGLSGCSECLIRQKIAPMIGDCPCCDAAGEE